MGIRFRKSFKVGPVRVNLSKSGVGASVGVKGARVGVDAKGNAYAAGGKDGVYFRENLGNKENKEGKENTTSNEGKEVYVFCGVVFAILGLILLIIGITKIGDNPTWLFVFGSIALIIGLLYIKKK